LLDGGTGNDTLTGGSGTCTFVFRPGYGRDTITNFFSGTDKLDLRGWGIGSFDKLNIMYDYFGESAVIQLSATDSVVLEGFDGEFDYLVAKDFLL
jgi:serralysin